MWALTNSDNTINEIITRPKQLIIGDTQYPRTIFNMWSKAELSTLKIYEVITDNSNFKDTQYYINTNATHTFHTSITVASTDYTNVVIKAYGTATARALTNVLFTAADESANSINVEGTVKQYGITTQLKENVNLEAANILQLTDWYTLRAASGGTGIPSSVSTHQAAVRTKANAMCTLITNAANVDALAALYVYNSATPAVRPLGEFPKLGE